LVLLDRRAAHERVWFERLREQFRAGAVPSQRLLLPVAVELDPVATALLLDRLKFLHAHGFEVGEFGRNFFRIEAVPAWMEPADAEPFLRDLLGAFRDGRLPDKDTDLARDELARLAVAKAVRLPERANEAELQGRSSRSCSRRAPRSPTPPVGPPISNSTTASSPAASKNKPHRALALARIVFLDWSPFFHHVESSLEESVESPAATRPSRRRRSLQHRAVSRDGCDPFDSQPARLRDKPTDVFRSLIQRHLVSTLARHPAPPRRATGGSPPPCPCATPSTSA
jgi:DNA mismatch repair ATPase MutL